MITKSQIQFIRSLEQKRVRDESSCFLVEGDKMVREALALPMTSSFRVEMVIGLEDWLNRNESIRRASGTKFISVSALELGRISLQKSPNQVLAVVCRLGNSGTVIAKPGGLVMALEQIQDPGNVGTIIRLADWFGLDGVVATPDSADFFSPKVVQASMGSIFRVPVETVDLAAYIRNVPDGWPVYGTHLGGENIYQAEIDGQGLIILGNESKGLSDQIGKLTRTNLLIPNFGLDGNHSESLNVSIAAAIICSEFRRRGNG